MALPKNLAGLVIVAAAVAGGVAIGMNLRSNDSDSDFENLDTSAETVSVSAPASSQITAQIPPVPSASPTAVPQAAPAMQASISAPTPIDLTTGPATGLQGYFQSLDASNSQIHVVQPGDNLTKISKQYGVTVGQIMAASGLTDPNKLQVGMKLKIMKDKWAVLVDKATYTLYLKAGTKTVETYKIGLGKDNSTPVGSFKIVNKLEKPTWYHEGKVLPFGHPENPLGTRWMGFDIKSYGLHGTIVPESVGKSESLGCVRMLNSDVERLYDLLPVGTPVTIVEKLGGGAAR